MNEPDATYLELGKRLAGVLDLPADVASVRERLASLKHVDDPRVHRESTIELGREVVRLHGTSLVPDDLQERVRRCVNAGTEPAVKSTSTQTHSALGKPLGPRRAKQPFKMSRYAVPAGAVLLAVLAALGRNGRIEKIAKAFQSSRPLNQQPSQSPGSGARPVRGNGSVQLDPLMSRNRNNANKARTLAEAAKSQFSWGSFEDDMAERIDRIRNGEDQARLEFDQKRAQAISKALGISVGRPQLEAANPRPEPRVAENGAGVVSGTQEFEGDFSEAEWEAIVESLIYEGRVPRDSPDDARRYLPLYSLIKQILAEAGGSAPSVRAMNAFKRQFLDATITSEGPEAAKRLLWELLTASDRRGIPLISREAALQLDPQ